LINLILRRLLSVIPVILGMTILTFMLSHIVPADPARLLAGPRASAAIVEKIRHDNGLDLPVWQQYMNYMSGVLHFDFGQSFSSFRPVSKDLSEYFPASAELTLFALLFALIFGVGVGIISAVWQDSWADQAARFLAINGISMPVFWLGLLAQLLLYQQLGWFPYGGRISDNAVLPPVVTGLLTFDSFIAGNTKTFFDALHHLILPAFVLGLEPLAILARITRTALIEVMREPYVTTARAKGLREKTVIFQHALRNALLPIVTMIGLLIGYLLGGSVMVETVFTWPGIGRYAARAISSADYNAVMGVTLVISLIYLFSNLIVDLLYARLDPRIGYK
jgi:peptide/nickel transport system permease protein